MTLSVGVVGTGRMGHDHALRLNETTTGVHVGGVFDVDPDRSAELARSVGSKIFDDALELIYDSSIEAIVVASPGPTHVTLVRAAIEAGKPVLCEKPLATTVAGALEVMAAEEAAGRRLVQVGFMRRHDPGYVAMKRVLDAGEIGDPLLAHCIHRNATIHDEFTSTDALRDGLVHEFDVIRWLLDDEITQITVLSGKRSPSAADVLADPSVIVLRTGRDLLVTIEHFVNCGYGYDVRCEIVSSSGTIGLRVPTDTIEMKDARMVSPVSPDWADRFADAYAIEVREWVRSISTGIPAGASAWDGYVAMAVAEAGIESRSTGAAVTVRLEAKPEFYA